MSSIEWIDNAMFRDTAVEGRVQYLTVILFCVCLSLLMLKSLLLVLIQWHFEKNLLTYLLTPQCRVHSWEANWFAASQEIPRISRNPKVHYRTHKRPPPISILDQPNPVHIPTSHLLEIHPNIIHPSTSRSPQWSLSLRFPQQDPIRPPPPHPYAPHVYKYTVYLNALYDSRYTQTVFPHRLLTD